MKSKSTKVDSSSSGTVVDVNRLKEKIQSEFSFISNALDRVPSVYWLGNNEDSDSSEDLTATGPKIFNSSDKTSRADNPEELMNRLETIKAMKRQGRKDASKKKKKKESKDKLRIVKQNTHQRNVHEKNLQTKLSKQAKQANDQPSKSGSSDPPDQKPVKPVFNSSGKMVFSKFDLTEVDSVQFDKKKKTESKDPKKILEKLKKKKLTLQKLKTEGKVDKVFEIKNKDAWSSALKKAEGIKVKDDPILLQKTIKRQESYKNSHAKKWNSRVKGQQKAVEAKIQKREANLQSRVDAKQKKKKAQAIKKGRIIPGVTPGF